MLEDIKPNPLMESPEESPEASPRGTLLIIGILMATMAAMWGLVFTLLINRS